MPSEVPVRNLGNPKQAAKQAHNGLYQARLITNVFHDLHNGHVDFEQ